MKFILLVILIVGGFQAMLGDPLVIQETITNLLFFGAGVLVLIFGIKIFAEAIKG